MTTKPRTLEELDAHHLARILLDTAVHELCSVEQLNKCAQKGLGPLSLKYTLHRGSIQLGPIICSTGLNLNE